MKKKILVILLYLLVTASFIIPLSAMENEVCKYNPNNMLPYNFGSIRQPAEFEPMESVLIRYPFGVTYDIIAEMAEDVEVITIIGSESEKNTVENLYQNNGVNTDHTSYLIAPSDSYWTRDYGPWFIFNQTGNDLEVVDFEYNRPRPDDNNIPYEFAVNQSLNYTYMDLIHTGGNYMTDGQGISVSTKLVCDENNDKTYDEINQTMNQCLGIHTYHVRPDVNAEYIKHVDCWVKYLSPDTLLIREVPPDHSQYDEIEEAVDYFEIQMSCYDSPYDIVRVYTPNDEPYTNSLILNDKVLIPQTGSQWDDEAIIAYQTAMPGYEVLGFTAPDAHPWESTDALHCRVKGIPNRNMLYIEHIPLSGYNGFTVKAKIISYSGKNITTAVLFWKIEGDDWHSIQMNHIGDSFYKSRIPIQELGETVYYYIEVEDKTGRREHHPFIGKDNAHSFFVYNLPPETPTVTGSQTGKKGITYTYTAHSTDPEGDMVEYWFEWGDGNNTGWQSDSSASYTWKQNGDYTVKVKAKDDKGAESNWGILEVTMPKNGVINQVFLKFLENHPHLFSLFQLFLEIK